MKPGASPCVLIGPRLWETPPPHGPVGRVSGLAGVPGPRVSFTKVNETKGTGWWGGEVREPREARKCTNQRLPRAHNCRRRPENKPVRGGPGAGAASLRPSPAALGEAPGPARDPPPLQLRRPGLR